MELGEPRLVRDALHEMGEANADQIDARFKGAVAMRVCILLDSLTALGDEHVTEEGRYAA